MQRYGFGIAGATDWPGWGRMRRGYGFGEGCLFQSGGHGWCDHWSESDGEGYGLGFGAGLEIPEPWDEIGDGSGRADGSGRPEAT